MSVGGRVCMSLMTEFSSQTSFNYSSFSFLCARKKEKKKKKDFLLPQWLGS